MDTKKLKSDIESQLPAWLNALSGRSVPIPLGWGLKAVFACTLVVIGVWLLLCDDSTR